MGAARNERQQQELPSFQAGDLCETVAPIILREAEPVHSKVLHGIDVGTTVQLLELGQDHRRARSQLAARSDGLRFSHGIRSLLLLCVSQKRSLNHDCLLLAINWKPHA